MIRGKILTTIGIQIILIVPYLNELIKVVRWTGWLLFNTYITTPPKKLSKVNKQFQNKNSYKFKYYNQHYHVKWRLYSQIRTLNILISLLNSQNNAKNQKHRVRKFMFKNSTRISASNKNQKKNSTKRNPSDTKFTLSLNTVWSVILDY